MPDSREKTQEAIREALAAADIALFPADAPGRLADYMELLQRWNLRLNLSAIRGASQIIERHFVESVFAAQHIAPGTSTLLDYGSGAGFPGIPIAICRPEIRVTLAEAQARKASFLREAVRVTASGCEVYNGRVDAMTIGRRFAVVTMRAVEKMEAQIPLAALRASKALLLLTTNNTQASFRAAVPTLHWDEPLLLPNSREGCLLIGRRE